MLSGYFNLLALRIILNAHITGKRLGLALSDNKSNCLAILAVLLDAPGDPNRVSYVERRIIDILQLAFRLVKENWVFSDKCFYDMAARWVNTVINLWLGCLRVFANSGANIPAKGDYIGKEAAIRFWVVGFTNHLLDFSQDDVIQWSLLYGYVFFFYNVAYDDPYHIVIVVEIKRGPVFLELKEHVDSCWVSA
jgi:hypothetical protein